MDWEAVGAVGELLGGVVVLASLAFLAVQIRRHTRALEVTSSEESNRAFAAYTARFIQPGISRIYRIGLASPEELDADELVTFNAVISTFFNFLAHSHTLRSRGVMSSWSSEEGLNVATMYILRQPGGRAWWNRFRVTYNEDFRSSIDQMCDPAD